MSNVAVAGDVRGVLSELVWEGNECRIECQLDRKLYVAVDKVLQAFGGKWHKGRKCHVFEDDDAVSSVQEAAMTGVYTDRKKLLQFFETPVGIVDEMIAIAGVGSGYRVLEPSAGMGAISERLLARGCEVTCVEIDQKCCEHLRKKSARAEGYVQKVGDNRYVDVFHQDFLRALPGLMTTEMTFANYYFDAVLMNPPFSKGQELDHVQHAFRFLRSGGILVSVMSTAFEFRSGRKWDEFREFFQRNGGIVEQRLAPGAFKSSGTNVSTVIVSITKR